jgi:hypothetical protein
MSKIKIIFKEGANNLTEEEKKEFSEIFRKREDLLFEAGYKTIEIDSLGGFYLRGIKKGCFFPLTTMHLARLLKK